MQLEKISLNKICFFLICFGLISFPINYEIISSFRLIDLIFFVLLILFFFLNPKIDKLQLAIFSLVAFFYLISNLIGSFDCHFFDFSKLGFIYKYLFIFIIPWVVVSVVKTKKQIRVINRILLINFVFLSSWTYIYIILLKNERIIGSFRPSFPFSNDYMASDAHLYSAYLGFFIVAYLCYFRKFFSHNGMIFITILTNGIVGLILTGSRSGVFIVGLFIFIYILYFILNTFSLKSLFVEKKLFVYFVLFLFIILGLTMIFRQYLDVFLSNYEKLFQRAFNFSLLDDQSSKGRIYKLVVGIEDSKYSGFLLGLGMYSSLIWYDGLFSILLAHGGISFIFSIFLFYYLIIRKVVIHSVSQKDYLLFLLLAFIYLIANMITEYIFVSRNAFPILVMLSILYVSIVKKTN